MSRRVLVTGGSRGIGRAIALECGAAGFDVTLTYQSRADAARAVVAEIEEKGGRAAAIALDIADREATRETLERAVTDAGAFYGVVCNAGISRDNAFPAMSDDDDTSPSQGISIISKSIP